MRPVKLVTGVNVETVMCDRMDSLEVRLHQWDFSPCYSTMEALQTGYKEGAKTHVVPIKRWVESHYKSSVSENVMPYHINDKAELVTEEGYIAVNPELDETLGKYIKLISSEANEKVEEAYRKRDYYWQESDRLKGVINSFDKASFWVRLGYLFTGRMKIE
jgi:hypothetical protein